MPKFQPEYKDSLIEIEYSIIDDDEIQLEAVRLPDFRNLDISHLLTADQSAEMINLAFQDADETREQDMIARLEDR